MPPSQTTPLVTPSPGAPPVQPREFLADLARLLQGPLPAAEFHAEFLGRVLAGLGARAGAVWSCSSQGEFRLEHQVNLAVVPGRPCPGKEHTQTLNMAARQQRPLWVPPHSGAEAGNGKLVPTNPTDHGLFLAPVLLEGRTAGVVEVWTEGDLEPRAAKATARLLGEAAGFVAAYLHRVQWEQLQEQQQLWARMDAFTHRAHSSLQVEEVAHLVANEGRDLLGCEQLGVAIRSGRAVSVAAVSGAPTVEQRSPLVRAMADLARAVLAWGERLVYTGQRDGGLPPDVLAALDTYLARSNSRFLLVEPLRDGREAPGEGPRSVLLAESFGPDLPIEALQIRLKQVAPHAATALFNATEHGGAPLRRLSNLLARLRGGLRGRRGAGAVVALALAAALVATLTFVPVPLRMEARGELMPRDRQIVYANLSGKVVEVKARHGEIVSRGQELLLMEDLELQLQIEQLNLRVSAAEGRIALLGQQLARATGEERNALAREKVSQEYEMRRAAAERDILLQGSRNPRRTPVPAPLAGKVVTFDAREQLVGKAVKPGDPLLRVARVDGPWEVELYLPEGHIGPVREGLGRSSRGSLEVNLLLSSHPHRTFKGRLTRDGLGGETVVRDNEVVLPTRVQITDPDLLAQLETMPVGVEVRARVNCGPCPIGKAWFFGLWEFFYEHVLF